MARREIHNELDRANRNNHNDNYEELYRLKKVVNDLVLNSGESDAEVVQARAGEETLNDRLDIMEDKTENVSKDMVELEEDLTKETEKRLQATLDEVEDTVQDIVDMYGFKGVMLTKTKNQKIEEGKYVDVEWDRAEYNISGFWDISSPTKIVIPAGVKKVRLSTNVLWTSTFDGERVIRMMKNGNYAKGLVYDKRTNAGTSGMSGTSSVVETKEGDYFELEVYHNNTGSERELREDPYTWFSLEVVEYSKK